MNVVLSLVTPLTLVRAAPTQSYTPWHVRLRGNDNVEVTRCETMIAREFSESMAATGLLQPSGPRTFLMCVFCMQTLGPADG